MEMGTLGIGRRTEQGALAEAKESVDRAIDDLALVVLEAQERERVRLADELHDGPAQALSNLIMQCEIIERQLREDPVLAVEELHRLRQLLRSELEMLRGYIYQLRPPLAESDDLNVALTEAAQRIDGAAGVPIEVTLEAPAEGIERAARSAVLRVAQEALRNIGKHSDAQRVLEVGDDGRGFDAQHLGGEARPRHFGLRFMRERSDLLGARLTIDSNPGQGTVVRLAVNSSGSVR
jgi:two-component system sensor histidine kinase DegS